MSSVDRNDVMKKIGYWKSSSYTFAGIAEVIAARGKMTREEINAVIKYIEMSKGGRRSRGCANCRACNNRLGSCDMETPDERFVFPQRYEHYILVHEVRPPQLFIDAAIEWINE